MDGVKTNAPPARLTLFGFSPTPAEVEVVYRPRSWRVTRALLSLLIALGLAPVVGLAPPHFPWAFAAIIIGMYLAAKRWTETYTLKSFRGTCPKCGAELSDASAVKLKQPHKISCGECQHDLLLEVDVRAVATGA